MTFAKGCVPWNRGQRAPLGWCYRHAERRVRVGVAGRTVCRTCHRQATVAWNRAHADDVAAARARHRAKGHACAAS